MEIGATGVSGRQLTASALDPCSAQQTQSARHLGLSLRRRGADEIGAPHTPDWRRTPANGSKEAAEKGSQSAFVGARADRMRQMGAGPQRPSYRLASETLEGKWNFSNKFNLSLASPRLTPDFAAGSWKRCDGRSSAQE
jgi:hypothetical protein